jgi:hypothetical protein
MPCRHLRTVIRFDPKILNKPLSREEILEDLKNSNKSGEDGQTTERCHQGDHWTTRCQLYEAQGCKVSVRAIAYDVVFSAVVWNEQEQREYREDQSIMFKSDLKAEEITKEIIEDIVEMYYADRDYPDFIRLSKLLNMKT